MASALKARRFEVDVELKFSTRIDTLDLVKQIKLAPNLIQIFLTGMSSGGENVAYPYHVRSTEARRLDKGDLETIKDLQKRKIYVCGPVPFMTDVQEWLQELNVDAASIYTESFTF